MAARRCTFCGLDYPAIAQFETCPIHDEPTDLLANASPSPDWQKRFEKLKVAQDEAERPIPRVKGVEAFEQHGLTWVYGADLFRAGMRLPHTTASDFKLFELDDGCVYETQGWDDPRRRWWIEKVTCNEEEASQLTTSADVHSSTESATN